MSREQVLFNVLKQVVSDQQREFTTKDVSEDERMRLAHPDLVEHSHYHAFVGGALSDHHVALGIVEVGKAPPRGTCWEKNGLAEPAVPPARTTS